MKAATQSLIIAVALVVSAGSADARPPRFSANHAVPIQNFPSLDPSRYGEPVPYSARGSAFYEYGVAYPAPASRNYAGATPAPAFRPYYGGSNIGYYGTFRDRRR